MTSLRRTDLGKINDTEYAVLSEAVAEIKASRRSPTRLVVVAVRVCRSGTVTWEELALIRDRIYI